jgi:hypothetical protein
MMGYVDEEGDFPKSRQAFAADAVATIVGSFFGLSPVTSYIESAAGVAAGSRTGLTAIFCGLMFFMSIFFAPIIASIPPVRLRLLCIILYLTSRVRGDLTLSNLAVGYRRCLGDCRLSHGRLPQENQVARPCPRRHGLLDRHYHALDLFDCLRSLCGYCLLDVFADSFQGHVVVRY